jgi:chromosome segregation ATPase
MEDEILEEEKPVEEKPKEEPEEQSSKLKEEIEKLKKELEAKDAEIKKLKETPEEKPQEKSELEDLLRQVIEGLKEKKPCPEKELEEEKPEEEKPDEEKLALKKKVEELSEKIDRLTHRGFKVTKQPQELKDKSEKTYLIGGDGSITVPFEDYANW